MVSASSSESINDLLRSIARTRVRTTAGCSGLIRNSSAPEEIPTISFSTPWMIGDHQDRDQLRGPVRFHPAAQLRAAHLRQHQIQNHQIDLFGIEQRRCFGRLMRLQDLIRRGFEDGLQQAGG